MRVVLQRVKYAKVSVGGEVAGQIEKGYLLLLGIGPDDTKATAEKMLDKIIKPYGVAVHAVCRLQKGYKTRLFGGCRAEIRK